MSLLGSLINLAESPFKHHQQAQPAPQQAPQGYGGTGNTVNIPLNRRPEDASYVQSQQGYTPMNADIAHIQTANPFAQGNQINPGYSPMQATSSFGGGSLGVQPQGYGSNPQQIGLQNPQVKDNGFYYY